MSNSDSEEDSAIQYGTPLDPYEEDEVPSKRKFQQQPDQYALDANGRRRFHGAFTGGFSAGYGNSVGTPEGWTPSTFKSSRSEKASLARQRPEDFMDEEDRGEFGIAPRHLHTQSEFSGQKRPRQRQFHDGPIPGEPVLDQFIRAVHETAAVRMLRAMGWKQGQGTGERLSKDQKRKAQDQHKVYGCYMPPEMKQSTQSEDEDSSSSEVDYDTLFAPDDYEPYMLQRKNDRFGLGYTGLSRHSILGKMVGEYGSDAGSSRSHLVMKEKGKKVSIRGQAFGVGAFEADDEDIYSTEDMSHYDFTLGGADDKNKKNVKKETSNNVIEGFVKASKPLPPVSAYPTPALPRDYTPAPAGSRRTRFEPTDQPQRDQGLGRHELTAAARGALLGETPVPKPKPNSPNDRTKPVEVTDKDDAIAKIMGRNVNFVSNEPPLKEPKELDFIPISDTGGGEFVKVFKPFANDRDKQARYERFLRDRTSAWNEDGQADRLSKWEMEREVVEFEQAAKLYRPLTGVMGDRFTHASEPDDALNPLSAVTRSTNNYGLATPEQMEAASRCLYGVTTRREIKWRPDALVCKRFNVPEPGGERSEEKKEDKPKVSYSVFSYMESSVHDKESFAKEQTGFSGSKSLQRARSEVTAFRDGQTSSGPERESTGQTTEATLKTVDKVSSTTNEAKAGSRKRMTVAELFLKESEKSKNEGEEVTETINKFDKMDLYKSIFLSDSEDEEPEKDVRSVKDSEDFTVKPKNLQRNTSPPRGIFANIDFDELNSWRRNVEVKKSETGEEENKKKASVSGHVDGGKVEEEEAALYGPRIPDDLKKRLQSDNAHVTQYPKRDDDIQEIESSSSSDSWVDVKELKKKKKSSKEKKKKVKKHKSKHKKSKSKHKKRDKSDL